MGPLGRDGNVVCQHPDLQPEAGVVACPRGTLDCGEGGRYIRSEDLHKYDDYGTLLEEVHVAAPLLSLAYCLCLCLSLSLSLSLYLLSPLSLPLFALFCLSFFWSFLCLVNVLSGYVRITRGLSVAHLGLRVNEAVATVHVQYYQPPEVIAPAIPAVSQAHTVQKVASKDDDLLSAIPAKGKVIATSKTAAPPPIYVCVCAF